ncbi:hypothetical protein ACVWZK_001469 [Bradyrhizobium sp. GM0.4]
MTKEINLMTTENVINIDDARELRALGLPILPIVDKEFSKAAEKLKFEAGKAKAQFYLAFRDYCKGTPTKQRFNRMRRALDKIFSISGRASRFTSADECEADVVQVVLTEPMVSFFEFWDHTLSIVEGGEPVTINVTQAMLDGWALPDES